MDNLEIQILDISRRALKEMISLLKLSPDEVKVVNDAAATMVDGALSAMNKSAGDRIASVRPIIVIAAIAFIVGPNAIWTRGIEALFDDDTCGEKTRPG